MRGLMLRILGAAAIGVVLSQGVALVCYARAAKGSLTQVRLAPRDLRLPAFLRGVWPAPADGWSETGLRPGHTSTVIRCPLDAPPDFRDNPPSYGLYTEAFGWPARSLVAYWPVVGTSGANGGTVDMQAFYDDFARRAGLTAGVVGPSWMPRNGRLGATTPVWPLWPGLAVNASLYGALAAAVSIVPGRIRRAVRRRNGLCVRCGYDVAGLTVCPECGPPAGAA